jgi:ribosomal protein S6--L-glutamate ligase
VNSSPGLQGIETSTGLDIAGMIIDYLERMGEEHDHYAG